MNPITLEITVKFAEVFKKNTGIGKMHYYTTVTLIGSHRISSECRTIVDTYGSSVAFWFIPASFGVDELEILHNKLMLVFEVKAKNGFGLDKNVGTIYVPVKELFDKSEKQNFVLFEHVALGFNSEMGKPRGVLYFSYLFRLSNIVRAHVPSAPPLPQELD